MPRELRLERNQRLAVVILRPPFPGHDPRTFGHSLGVSQPSVSAQHPLGLGWRPDLIDRPATKLHEATSEHRRIAYFRAGRHAVDELAEPRCVVPANVEHEVRGARLRKVSRQLANHRMVRQSDCHQQRQPCAERQYGRTGETAGPAQVPDGKCDFGNSRARSTSRETSYELSKSGEKREYGRQPQAEVNRDPARF